MRTTVAKVPAALRRTRALDRQRGPTPPSVRLIDAPLHAARATEHWLRELPARDEWGANADCGAVLGSQIRGLNAALRKTAPVLVDVVDQIIAAAPNQPAKSGNGAATVMLDVGEARSRAREASNILVTIDHLARRAGTAWSGRPAATPRLATWIADEIDTQSAGHLPHPYSASRPLPSPPCPLLRAAITHDIKCPSLHAYGHEGLTARQITAVRASDVTTALAARPGVTMDQLMSQVGESPSDLLGEVGQLIALGALFGIDRRWYPYDITVLALRNAWAAHRGCGCPRLTPNGTS
jgi:hypothetical protein